jgi:hypothetical protein
MKSNQLLEEGRRISVNAFFILSKEAIFLLIHLKKQSLSLFLFDDKSIKISNTFY